jgi:filamentous hemagglutinin family protein
VKFPASSLYIYSAIGFGLFLNSQVAVAQSIQTDGTTPTQPTSCSSDCLIEGGLQQGENLFHSFERFNVDAGATVLFQDPGVANILSRVTGNEVSEILGTLGVSGGDANLFLLNPNGIIFGQDSSLDLNGSFLATTADGIRFGEQGLLGSDPQEIPLLTIDPTALVFAEGDPGAISNQSKSSAGDNPNNLEALGLQVPDGESLLLVGGDVTVNNGSVTALGGRIELGGLAGAGEVELNFSDVPEHSISLDFPEQAEKGNVFLTNDALIRVFTSDNGGDIMINAQNITISEKSLLGAGLFGDSTTFDSQAGNITLNATGKIEVINGSEFANQVITKGSAGDIKISADSLLIDNASYIDASIFGQGNAGNIDILLTGNLVVTSESFIISQIVSEARGNAGNINIEANSISLDGGSQLASNVFGQGKGGNISLNAMDSVDIAGFGTEKDSSGIFTALVEDGVGTVGSITVNTDNFRIADGAIVSSQTLGEGDSGNISINTNNFEAINGGQIATSTASYGNAGNINIKISETLLLSGSEPDFANRLAEFGDIVNEAPGNSGFFANVRLGASGKGGNIEIEAKQLSILDNAEINVSATGTGEAGSLSIDAQDINLDRGSILAETRVGDQGNITVSNADSLLLRNNSQITTNATEQATGGDITISSNTLALLDDSDITANAVSGRGGNIAITTQGIFQEPDSQITAASELGIDGTITINSLDVDPTSGIIELPNVPIDAEAILAENLCRFEDNKIAKGSSFIITGRGGLTPTSADSLSDVDHVVNWASREDLEVSQNGAVAIRQREANNSVNTSYPDIQQSQSLMVAADGSTWLTANAPNASDHNPNLTHPDCRTLASENR